MATPSLSRSIAKHIKTRAHSLVIKAFSCSRSPQELCFRVKTRLIFLQQRDSRTKMKPLFSSSEKIGDIVSRFPKASEIFTEYGIDFCCGGQRPLLEAIEEKGFDESDVLGRLGDSYQDIRGQDRKDVDWRTESAPKLMDHLVNTHHVHLRTELPQLSDLLTTILRVHGASHGEVLSKVYRLFHNLKMDIDQHLIQEEEIVFPVIRDYVKNPTASQLARIVDLNGELMKVHDGAGDILKKLRRVTDQYRVPEDVCSTYETTYKKLKDLETDLFQHIHLENNVLIPPFEKQMM